MVIEFAAFVRGHRKDKRLVSIPLLISVPFGQVQRGQSGVKMKVELLFAASLTVGETRKLRRGSFSGDLGSHRSLPITSKSNAKMPLTHLNLL